ncbi:NUDIX domain-containing protein [Stenotrophomonas sp. Marseille-Q4652]|uniref:NUDIX domain-containing protein n=1 Tax=Stenotrophomonas sp. Marseille-Q4652 TaxID=2866595 RepID=UPI001CE44D0C|nr:NUDIX domain-containing protein [Stenotrophomonas sp. Marseille-Q4652]
MHSSNELLAEVSRILPRIAEESSDREEIPETDLIGRLIHATGVGAEEAGSVLSVVRRLLQALSVLDEARLGAGVWAFVSFPASLLARSVLGGLGEAEFRLLEPGFWNASEYLVDRQRALIKRSEELRAVLPSGLVPIRRVWVSWAWIAMDGKFLMVRREDPALHRDGSRGQFVFPGGRVSNEDLPELVYLTASQCLDFFDPSMEIDPSHIRYAFSQAARRELREELEIPSNAFEAVTPVDEPLHYTALEGAKSAYSATEYHIQPFKVALKDTGKTDLLRCLAAHPERFAWFTAKELAGGSNAAGAKAFVDAIRQGGPALDADTFTIPIGHTAPFKDPVDIPGKPSEPFAVGIAGRERQVHVDLGTDQIELLNWLAAVRRGEDIEELAVGVSIARGTGWVLIDDDHALTGLRALAAKLDAAGLPLLDFHDRAVRLNAVTPYFSPSSISMEIQDERRGKSYRLNLSRRRIQSILGVAVAKEASISLPEILGNAVYSLDQGDPQPALDGIETVKRMQREIRGFLDTIGARLLVRQVDGVPELAVGR